MLEDTHKRRLTQPAVVAALGALLAAVVAAALVVAVLASWARAEELTASYYTFNSCRREGTSGYLTASGERFDENALTCALRSYNFGGYYRVTNLTNGKSVIVRHNDFGPNKKLWKRGRIIDLSKAAFARIADLNRGVIRVKVEEVKFKAKK